MNERKYITYYGEYSLYHWLTMILSQEITLPNFQRYFVWDPKRTIKLMDSFDKGLFVPPVLIANFSGDNIDAPANYILDGQQRLSAIFLSYLGVFPARFEKIEYNEKFNDEEQGEQIVIHKVALDWDLRNLQKLYKDSDRDINTLKNTIADSRKYLPIDIKLAKLYNDTNDEDINLFNTLNIDIEFLKNKYLGYSYIKSVDADAHLEKQLFASIFKNINTLSVQLRHKESRSALYWISTEKRKFFQPSFNKDITVNKDKIDFTMYMALLSNTFNLRSKNLQSDVYNEIAIGNARKRRFEDYIVNYVESVISDENSEIFGKFSEIFPNYEIDLGKLNKYFEKGIDVHYYNNVKAEIYLFGLFYWVLFAKKDIKVKSSLFDKLNRFEDYHRKDYNNKNLNRLGATRDRIRNSIAIYEKYLES